MESIKVFEGIKYTLVYVFWWIVNGIISVIDLIQSFFYLFISNPKTGSEETTFLKHFFESIDLVKFYTILSVIAFIIMLLLAILTIIKQDYFDKEGPRSKGPIIINIGLGFFLFIALIPIATLAMGLFNQVLEAIYLTMSSGNQIQPLSDHLINASLPQLVNEGSTFDWSSLFPTDFQDSLLYSFFNNAPNTELSGFHWHLLLVGGLFIGWNLFSMIAELIKRVFNIIILYVSAPFEIARIVSDEGARFRKWKDKMIGQLFSLVIIVIAFLLFNLISGVAMQTRESVSTFINNEEVIEGEENINSSDPKNIGGALVVIIMMGGSLAVKSATKLVIELSGSETIVTKEAYKHVPEVSGVLKEKEKSSTVYVKSDSDRRTRPRIITRTIKKDTTKTVGASGTAVGLHPDMDQSRFSQRPQQASSGLGVSLSPPRKQESSLELRVSSGSKSTQVSTGDYFGSTGGSSGLRDIIGTTINTGIPKMSTGGIGLAPTRWNSVNEEPINESKQNYVQASMSFDTNVKSNSNFDTLTQATRTYLQAAEKENSLIKKDINMDQKAIAPLRKTFDDDKRKEYTTINTNYQNAQSDYIKSTNALSQSISKPGIDPMSVIKLKEKADQQRQKLASATSAAKNFYNRTKGG